MLGAGVAAAVGLALPRRRVAAQGFEVLPRSAWAGDLPHGPIPPEPEVRVLVVHHTVDGNDHGPDDVAVLLRRIHAFHTGGQKGWPDVAYNFFVDRFGQVWEGRAGSLDAAVAGDATGGSQGFDQKCAFVGDHRTDPPTSDAADAMASLLALLADRHGLDTAPGATATFPSRGSNLHPAGTTVTIPTISGHRLVSRTACPGDAGMALVTDVLPGAVTARRSSQPTTTTIPAAGTTTTATTVPATAAAPATTTWPPTTTATTSPGVPQTATVGDGDDGDGSLALPAGVAAVAALGAGALALRARQTGR